jgi:hypothetical protein
MIFMKSALDEVKECSLHPALTCAPMWACMTASNSPSHFACPLFKTVATSLLLSVFQQSVRAD